MGFHLRRSSQERLTASSRSLFSHRPTRGSIRSQKRPVPLCVEPLEDRTVPATAAQLAFLDGVYQEVLHRPLDGAGLHHWGSLLEAGASRFAVAYGIAQSLEGQVQSIQSMYEDLLGREADPFGLLHWTLRMQTGTSPEEVRASLLGSAEWAMATGGSEEGFLRGLYREELGRELDAHGAAYFGSQLLLGQSRITIGWQVLNSAEYRYRHVGALYNTLLQRPLDPSGAAFWVGGMRQGLSQTAVLAGILSADEFTNRLLPAGVSPAGPGSDPSSRPPKEGPGTVDPEGATPNKDVDPPSGSSDSGEGSGSENPEGDSGPVNPGGDSGSSPGPELPGGGFDPGGGSGFPGDGFFNGQLRLEAPEYATTTTPSLEVYLSDISIPSLRARIDVDLNNNGDFGDPGEQDFGFVSLGSEGPGIEYARPLPEGTLSIRARMSDIAGQTYVSDPTTILIDPHAGILGSQDLVRLHHAYTQLQNEGGNTNPDERLREFIESRPWLVIDDQARVLISVRAILEQHIDELKRSLEELAMSVLDVTPAQHMVSGYFPIENLLVLPSLRHYSAATPVWAPVRRVGSVTTQGDAVMGANSFRSNFGVDGSGVKVGVLSDSVNQVDSDGDGIGGVAESQLTGDLPSAGVEILMDSGSPFATDEGRAMLEIIHDVAPGADLAFHSTQTPQVFANGIGGLVAAGSRVVVDDIGFLNSPFFNDGVIAQAADNASAAGAVYLSAAGNDADLGWQDSFRAVNTTVGGISGTFHSLGGGDVLQNFTLPVGGLLVLAFQWDDAYLEGGSPLPNFQVNTDLDVLVTNSSGNQVLATANTNNLNTDDALEIVAFFNNGSFGSNEFALAYRLSQGPAPTALRWISVSSFGDNPNAQGQGAPTTWGQPAAQTAIAVGAVPFFSPATPESFTSLGGPLTFFFDAQGNRLSTPVVRQKPNVAAPDNVNTSFFPGIFSDIPQDPDFFPNFPGTSAAAPHAAAAIALVMQQQPGIADPTIYRLHQYRTAIDISEPGFDNLTGFGRVNLAPLTSLGIDPDAFDPNETSDQAISLGVLNGSQSFPDLAIADQPNGLPDYDWFRWRAGRTGTFTALVTQITDGDLELHLFTLNGTTLVPLASNTQTGAINRSLSVPVQANQPIFVEVKGRNSSFGVQDRGFYRLNVSIT